MARTKGTLQVFYASTALTLIASLSLALQPAPARADAASIDFNTYTLGVIHAQDGWSSLGAAGSGCAVYDHAVVDNTYGFTNFGARSLRISNAVTSGCFSDQTFSRSLTEEAGETSAENGGQSTGPRQRYFEAQWDFASTTPAAEQPGLSVVASPDRGDGARMSWVQMRDEPAGLAISFFEYVTGTGFVQTDLVTGLDRTLTHTVRVRMWFADGLNNDVVRVYVNGVLRVTGRSWEDYFREVEGNPTRTVDSILFRTSGTAAPALAGQGFLIDNLSLFSGPITPCTAACYVDAATGNDIFPGTAELPVRTIQAAIDRVSVGGTINVAAGTYPEAININRDSVTILGTSGAAATIIVGPRPSVVPGSDTVTFSSSGAVLDGFTITRAGNTVAEWADTRNQGVTFNGTGNTLRNSVVTGNRNGVLVAIGGNTVADSDITNNRTGVHVINQAGNLTLRNNTITDNWTMGVLFRQDLSAGGHTIEYNNITGNWYSQLEDRGNPSGLARVIERNYFGAGPFATLIQNTSGEPGYAAQIPVAFGGTATPPPTAPTFVVNAQDPNPNGDTGGRGNANTDRLDFDPWLCDGTDTSAALGFQPNTANLCGGAAPDTTILTSPPGITNTGNADFTFTGSDDVTPAANLTFECQLDGGAFAACTSPQSYSGLSDGAHAFAVRARDPFGVADATPASSAWTVDSTAPDTQITAGPPAIDSTDATFAFAGDDGAGTGVASLECRIDGGAWATCTSPATYTGLSGGPHTFDVRAVDGAGNIDPTPATYGWTVDTSLPNTQITGSPGSQSNSPEATFTFTGSDDTTPATSLTFECRLNGGPWGVCASPKNYAGLAEGPAVFEVRARDLGSNLDPSPAAFGWVIDLTAPETSITSGPPPVTTTTSATFVFTGTDNLTGAGALTFECKLDAGAWSICASPRTYAALSVGTHLLRVRAIDAAGNVDATPAEHPWIVQSGPTQDSRVYLPIVRKKLP